MAFILAADGGGTKTNFVLYNTAPAAQIDFMSFGTSSHEFLPGGYDEMRDKLNEMSGEILKKQNITSADIKYSVWGLAGLDTKSQYKTISAFIKGMGFKQFTLCNDSYLGVKAGLEGGSGICLINGTGPNVVGINSKNAMFQMGGQFELTGDFAGGLLLGKEAIKTCFFNCLFAQ